MSLHVSEPRHHSVGARRVPTWTCDVVETDTGAMLDTTLHYTDAHSAQAHASRIIARSMASGNPEPGNRKQE